MSSAELLASFKANPRFRGKVYEKANGCWQWTGRINTEGYPLFDAVPGVRFAHRVALELEGVDLTDKVVHHICGFSLCVRPSHLEVLTRKEHDDHRHMTKHRPTG